MVFFHKRHENSVKFSFIDSVSPSFCIQSTIRVQMFGKVTCKEIEKMFSGFAPEVKDRRQGVVYLTFGCERKNLVEVLCGLSVRKGRIGII